MIYQRTIRERIPYNVFQTFLNKRKIKSTQRYDDVFPMIDRKVSNGDANTVGLEEDLKGFVRDYTIFGKKIIYSYAFNQEEVTSFENTILSDERCIPLIDKYNALENFTSAELSNLPDGSSKLVAIFQEIDFTTLVFTGKKTINHRIELDPNDLRSRGTITKLFALEKITFQGFDCVIIDKKFRRIDFCLDNSLNLSAKRHIEDFFQLKNNFLTFFSINSHHFASNIDNFFGTVQKYYDMSVGVVTSLEFKTNTGSFKSAKMSDPNDDLRSEDFHAAGSLAVDAITPFSIDMRFKNSRTNNFFIQKIPGMKSCLNTANPIVQFFEIKEVVSHHDYLYLKEMLYN